MDELKNTEDTSVDINDTLNSLAKQIFEEPDPQKTQQLISLFNWTISKKNTSRILKLNELYDDVTDQMITRFKNKADQFSNSDVLDYLKAVQGAIDTSSKNLTQAEEPPTIVQQNNTQINVNVVDTFDRESKERILAAIQATLHQAESSKVVNEEKDNSIVEIDSTAE